MDNLANNLDEYATSRANFRDVSDEKLKQIAHELRISRSQVETIDLSVDVWEDKTGTWRDKLERKKDYYLYICGQAGIDFIDAKSMWWEYVYNGKADPQMRKYLV